MAARPLPSRQGLGPGPRPAPRKAVTGPLPLAKAKEMLKTSSRQADKEHKFKKKSTVSI